MDGWVPKGGSVPPAGDGAFERFLTAAIAAIITIMFSWRLLDDMNDGEVKPPVDTEEGRRQRAALYLALASQPATQARPEPRPQRQITDLDIDEGDDDVTARHSDVVDDEDAVGEGDAMDEGEEGFSDSGFYSFPPSRLEGQSITSVDLMKCFTSAPPFYLQQKGADLNTTPTEPEELSFVPGSRRQPQFSIAVNVDPFPVLESDDSGEEAVRSKGTSDDSRDLSDSDREMLDSGTTCFDWPAEEGLEFLDDVQPRELDSDEELYCCSLLEPIIEEDSDDFLSSSGDSHNLALHLHAHPHPHPHPRSQNCALPPPLPAPPTEFSTFSAIQPSPLEMVEGVFKLDSPLIPDNYSDTSPRSLEAEDSESDESVQTVIYRGGGGGSVSSSLSGSSSESSPLHGAKFFASPRGSPQHTPSPLATGDEEDPFNGQTKDEIEIPFADVDEVLARVYEANLPPQFRPGSERIDTGQRSEGEDLENSMETSSDEEDTIDDITDTNSEVRTPTGTIERSETKTEMKSPEILGSVGSDKPITEMGQYDDEGQISNIPETISSFPQTVTNIPKTVTSIPEAVINIPKTISSIPETISSIPETIASIPETAAMNSHTKLQLVDRELTSDARNLSTFNPPSPMTQLAREPRDSNEPRAPLNAGARIDPPPSSVHGNETATNTDALPLHPTTQVVNENVNKDDKVQTDSRQLSPQVGEEEENSEVNSYLKSDKPSSYDVDYSSNREKENIDQYRPTSTTAGTTMPKRIDDGGNDSFITEFEEEPFARRRGRRDRSPVRSRNMDTGRPSSDREHSGNLVQLTDENKKGPALNQSSRNKDRDRYNDNSEADSKRHSRASNSTDDSNADVRSRSPLHDSRIKPYVDVQVRTKQEPELGEFEEEPFSRRRPASKRKEHSRNPATIETDLDDYILPEKTPQSHNEKDKGFEKRRDWNLNELDEEPRVRRRNSNERRVVHSDFETSQKRNSDYMPRSQSSNLDGNKAELNTSKGELDTSQGESDTSKRSERDNRRKSETDYPKRRDHDVNLDRSKVSESGSIDSFLTELDEEPFARRAGRQRRRRRSPDRSRRRGVDPARSQTPPKESVSLSSTTPVVTSPTITKPAFSSPPPQDSDGRERTVTVPDSPTVTVPTSPTVSFPPVLQQSKVYSSKSPPRPQTNSRPYDSSVRASVNVLESRTISIPDAQEDYGPMAKVSVTSTCRFDVSPQIADTPQSVGGPFDDADVSNAVESMPRGYTFTRCASEFSRRDKRMFVVDRPMAPDFETFINSVPFTSEAVMEDSEEEEENFDDYSAFVQELRHPVASSDTEFTPAKALTAEPLDEACILSGNLVASPTVDIFKYPGSPTRLPAVSSVAQDLYNRDADSSDPDNASQAEKDKSSKAEASSGEVLDTSFDIDNTQAREKMETDFAFLQDGTSVQLPARPEKNDVAEEERSDSSMDSFEERLRRMANRRSRAEDKDERKRFSKGSTDEDICPRKDDKVTVKSDTPFMPDERKSENDYLTDNREVGHGFIDQETKPDKRPSSGEEDRRRQTAERRTSNEDRIVLDDEELDVRDDEMRSDEEDRETNRRRRRRRNKEISGERGSDRKRRRGNKLDDSSEKPEDGNEGRKEKATRRKKETDLDSFLTPSDEFMLGVKERDRSETDLDSLLTQNKDFIDEKRVDSRKETDLDAFVPPSEYLVNNEKNTVKPRREADLDSRRETDLDAFISPSEYPEHDKNNSVKPKSDTDLDSRKETVKPNIDTNLDSRKETVNPNIATKLDSRNEIVKPNIDTDLNYRKETVLDSFNTLNDDITIAGDNRPKKTTPEAFKLSTESTGDSKSDNTGSITLPADHVMQLEQGSAVLLNQERKIETALPEHKVLKASEPEKETSLPSNRVHWDVNERPVLLFQPEKDPRYTSERAFSTKPKRVTTTSLPSEKTIVLEAASPKLFSPKRDAGTTADGNKTQLTPSQTVPQEVAATRLEESAPVIFLPPPNSEKMPSKNEATKPQLRTNELRAKFFEQPLVPDTHSSVEPTITTKLEEAEPILFFQPAALIHEKISPPESSKPELEESTRDRNQEQNDFTKDRVGQPNLDENLDTGKPHLSIETEKDLHSQVSDESLSSVEEPPKPKPRLSQTSRPTPMPRSKSMGDNIGPPSVNDFAENSDEVFNDDDHSDTHSSVDDDDEEELAITNRKSTPLSSSEKRPKSLKEIRRKLTQQRSNSRPMIAPFTLPDHLIVPSRVRIMAKRKHFLSSENLDTPGGTSLEDQFAAHKLSQQQPKERKYKPNKPPRSPLFSSSQDQLEKLNYMLNYSRHSESSFDRSMVDHLHENCILTPEGRRDILNKTMSIENLQLDLSQHLRRFGSVTSLVQTDIDTGETSETNFFPETNLDIFDCLFQPHEPLQRSASMSDLAVAREQELQNQSFERGVAGGPTRALPVMSLPPSKTHKSTGKDRFAHRKYQQKSKSLCTLETNLDDVDEDGGELRRVPSVHELRVTKSLMKLNVPDWFKRSSLSKSSSCLLKYGSNSTVNSSFSAFSPSLVSSPCASTAPPAPNVVIKTRVVPPSSRNPRTAAALRGPSSHGPGPASSAGLSDRRTAAPTAVKLPSEKLREQEKNKKLMPIPIVPFSQIRAMFEKKAKKGEEKAEEDKDNDKVGIITKPEATKPRVSSPPRTTPAVPSISISSPDSDTKPPNNRTFSSPDRQTRTSSPPAVAATDTFTPSVSASSQLQNVPRHSDHRATNGVREPRDTNEVVVLPSSAQIAQPSRPGQSSVSDRRSGSVLDRQGPTGSGGEKTDFPKSAQPKDSSFKTSDKEVTAPKSPPKDSKQQFSPTRSLRQFFGMSKDKSSEKKSDGSGSLNSSFSSGDGVYEKEPRRIGVSEISKRFASGSKPSTPSTSFDQPANRSLELQSDPDSSFSSTEGRSYSPREEDSGTYLPSSRTSFAPSNSSTTFPASAVSRPPLYSQNSLERLEGRVPSPGAFSPPPTIQYKTPELGATRSESHEPAKFQRRLPGAGTAFGKVPSSSSSAENGTTSASKEPTQADRASSGAKDKKSLKETTV